MYFAYLSSGVFSTPDHALNQFLDHAVNVLRLIRFCWFFIIKAAISSLSSDWYQKGTVFPLWGHVMLFDLYKEHQREHYLLSRFLREFGLGVKGQMQSAIVGVLPACRSGS